MIRTSAPKGSLVNKKVFIDGGANVGQSTDAFLSQWPHSEEFDIFMFEPTKGSCRLLNLNYVSKNSKITLEKKAMWIKDGTINFFTKGDLSQGNTLSEEKTKKEKRQYTKQEVQCINLSRWIQDSFSRDDFLILKMDIEGAEYEVLEHLSKSGALEMIDVLFMEIHGLKCNKSFEESCALVEIANSHGLILYSWGAETFEYSNYKDNIYDRFKLEKEYKKWADRGLSVT